MNTFKIKQGKLAPTVTVLCAHNLAFRVALVNGIFLISYVMDVGPFTLAPYPLPLNSCYFYVVCCPLNFEHFWFYTICRHEGPTVT